MKSSETVTLHSNKYQQLLHDLQVHKDLSVKIGRDIDYIVARKDREMENKLQRLFEQFNGEKQAKQNELTAYRDAAKQQVNHYKSEMETNQQQFDIQLQEHRDWMERKISKEIQKTEEAHQEVKLLKDSFENQLKDLQHQHLTAKKNYKQEVRDVIDEMNTAKKEAKYDIKFNLKQCEMRLQIESEMNDEDVTRLHQQEQQTIQQMDEKYNQLNTKYYVQEIKSRQLITQHKEIEQQMEILEEQNYQTCKENEKLEDLNNLMMSHLQERDEKDSKSDKKQFSLVNQLKAANTYKVVANDRIQRLQSIVDPLKEDIHLKETRAESLQEVVLSQMDKFNLLYRDHEQLKIQTETLKTVLYSARNQLRNQGYFVDNFITQFYKILHQEQPSNWPKLFGLLYQDLVKGKEKHNWQKYLQNSTSKQLQIGDDKKYAEANLDDNLQVGSFGENQQSLNELTKLLQFADKAITFVKDKETRQKKKFDKQNRDRVQENSQLLSQIQLLKKEIRKLKQGMETSENTPPNDQLPVEQVQITECIPQQALDTSRASSPVSASAIISNIKGGGDPRPTTSQSLRPGTAPIDSLIQPPATPDQSALRLKQMPYLSQLSTPSEKSQQSPLPTGKIQIQKMDDRPVTAPVHNNTVSVSWDLSGSMEMPLLTGSIMSTRPQTSSTTTSQSPQEIPEKRQRFSSQSAHRSQRYWLQMNKDQQQQLRVSTAGQEHKSNFIGGHGQIIKGKTTNKKRTQQHHSLF